MNRPRRIQIQLLSPHHFLGGGAVHARGLAEGLRACGVEPVLLCTGEANPERDPVYARIDCVNPASRWGTWRLGMVSQLSAWARAARRTTSDVDGVVSLGALSAVATRIARPRLPLIFAPAVLDKVEHPHTRHAQLKYFEWLAFRCATALQLTTAPVANAVQQLYGPLSKPIGSAPLGIAAPHAPQPERVRRACGIPSTGRLLLTMGLVNENKGQRYLARALRTLPAGEWWWAVVGQGPDRALIERTLADSEWAARMIFVEADARPQDWHAAADLFAIASRHETFGLVVAEALRAGTPVLTPRHGLPDALGPLAPWVEAERLGWTFARNDVDALRAALRVALTDADARAACGRRAAVFAAREFCWSRYARETLAVIEACLKGRPCPDSKVNAAI